MQQLRAMIEALGFDQVIPCHARAEVREALPEARCEWLLLKRHTPYAAFPEDVPAVASHYPAYQAGYDAVQQLAEALRSAGYAAWAEQQFQVKPLMQAVGVGVQGKHTLVIHPQYGTWFCALQLQTALVPEDARLPEATEYSSPCGDCERCVQACPVGALDGRYRLERERCVRWHMMNGKAAPPEVVEAMRGLLVGCEACQHACPHNAKIRREAPPEALVEALRAQDMEALKAMLGRNLIRKQRLDLQLMQAMPGKDEG